MSPSSKILHRIRRLNRTGRMARPLEAAALKPRQAEAWPDLSLEQADEQWLGWFTAQGWTPFSFQREAWEAFRQGKSGLIAVATGSGKTYAALGGPLISLMANPPPVRSEQLSILYISPLKALVRDIAQAIQRPIENLRWPIEVGVRTGGYPARDSSPAEGAITPCLGDHARIAGHYAHRRRMASTHEGSAGGGPR